MKNILIIFVIFPLIAFAQHKKFSLGIGTGTSTLTDIPENTSFEGSRNVYINVAYKIFLSNHVFLSSKIALSSNRYYLDAFFTENNNEELILINTPDNYKNNLIGTQAISVPLGIGKQFGIKENIFVRATLGIEAQYILNLRHNYKIGQEDFKIRITKGFRKFVLPLHTSLELYFDNFPLSFTWQVAYQPFSLFKKQANTLTNLTQNFAVQFYFF